MQIPTPSNDAVAHHAANAAAIIFPVASASFSLPEWVTMIVGTLGALWYLVLFGEKIVKWRQQWLQIKASSRRVATKEIEKRHED